MDHPSQASDAPAIDADGLPEQLADRTETPRYAAEDLTPTGLRGTVVNKELFLGADGELHCVGDRHGTTRDVSGKPRDDKGWIADDNKPPPEGVKGPATVDTTGTVPTDGPQPTAEIVRQTKTDRDIAAAGKEQIFKQQVEPIAGRLQDAGLKVDRNTFGSGKFNEDLAKAHDTLSRTDRLLARKAAIAYGTASKALVRASEKLGVAGGNHAFAMLYPNARLVSGGDDARGVSGTLDRVGYRDGPKPEVIVMEDKGAGSTLGTRDVPDPANPGAKMKVQQCSPEYVRDLLSIDPKLAEALHADPKLRVVMQQTVNGANGGIIKCLLAHTSVHGVITVYEYLLDAQRIRRETLKLAPDDRRHP